MQCDHKNNKNNNDNNNPLFYAVRDSTNGCRCRRVVDGWLSIALLFSRAIANITRFSKTITYSLVISDV